MPCSDLLALFACFFCYFFVQSDVCLCSLIYDLYLFNQVNACVFLQSAKMFNYGTDWRRTRDTLFIAFAVVFLLTRLVIFPSK